MTMGTIPVRKLHWVWPEMWRLLEPAWKRSATKPNLLPLLLAHKADLWAIYEDGKPVAAIVTQVQEEPERRCLLWMVGGSRMAEWAGDFMATLSDVARAHGCVSIVGAGRKGWARIVRQFGGEPIDPIEEQPAWRLSLVEDQT